MQQLEQQLRSAQQGRQEAELQLHFATEEAQELRAAKEAAVVEKEQVAVRSERRSQAHEVRSAAEWSGAVVCLVWGCRLGLGSGMGVCRASNVAGR